MATDCNGVILGIVSEEGVIKANHPLILVDGGNLQPIARTVTDANGGYIFNNLDPYKTDYMIFTVDTDGDPRKNALIKSSIQPITTSNGVLNGNFWGMVDALAPDQAVAVFTSSGTNAAVPWTSTQVHRLGAHVGAVTIMDHGTATLREDLFPVPTSSSIVGMAVTNTTAGWGPGPQAWWHANDRDVSAPLCSTQPPLTMCVFNKFNGNAVTFSSCGYRLPDVDNSTLVYGATNNTSLAAYVFGNGTANTRAAMFNVCFETNGELRLKWYGTDNSRNNVLVKSGLVSGKWYMVVVRYGAVGEAFSVDVADCAAGTSERITPGTLRTTGMPYHDATSRRGGLWVSGALNIAGSIESTAYTNAVLAEIGPMFHIYRKISDAETDDLIKSAVNTTTPWRSQPRFLSEIMQHGPSLYFPGDEYVSDPNCRGASKGRKGYAQAVNRGYHRPLNYLSGRRRSLIVPGGGYLASGFSLPINQRFTYSYVWTRLSATPATLFGFAAMYPASDSNPNSYHDQLNISSTASGKPRIYFNRGDSASSYDAEASNSRAVAIGETVMVTVVADCYTNLKIRVYLNGVLADTLTTSQMYGRYAGSSQMGGEYIGSGRFGLMISAHTYTNSYTDYGTTGVTKKARDDLSVCSDVVFWPHMLNDAQVLELYNAWAIAAGPDSHA